MYTAFDAISYLMDSVGGGAQDQEHRVLRQSLFHAYRELVSARDWRWYHTAEEIDLCPSESVLVHTLPWGCQSVDAVQMIESPGAIAEYVPPMDFERLSRSNFNRTVRLIWTVAPSLSFPDRFDLKVMNGWQATQRCVLTYRRRPRDIRYTGWESQARSGTVSWNDKAVTGAGTQFTNLMIGSILRVSRDASKHPESLTGMNAYTDEGLIYQVNSPTSASVWSPAEKVSYSGVKYLVTDYLDISPGMYSALLSACEMWLSRLAGKNIEGTMGVYGRDLRLAFEQDAMAPLSGRLAASQHYYSWWYLRPGTDQGTGGGGMGGPDANGVCPLKPDVFGGASDTVFGGCA